RMIAQKRAPALTRRIASLGLVLADGRLRHPKAELEQFAMNVWCTPKPIVHAHPPDQRPQFRSDLRPASLGAEFPAPVTAKSSAMPAHDGLRPQDYHGLENRRAPPIKLDEEQAIAVGELDPAAHLALQHNHLASEHGILCFKSALGLEGRGNQVQQEEYQRDHRGRVSAYTGSLKQWLALVSTDSSGAGRHAALAAAR